nr:hypothetical transcript [Hymenolepis microstoma]
MQSRSFFCQWDYHTLDVRNVFCVTSKASTRFTYRFTKLLMLNRLGVMATIRMMEEFVIQRTLSLSPRHRYYLFIEK